MFDEINKYGKLSYASVLSLVVNMNFVSAAACYLVTFCDAAKEEQTETKYGVLNVDVKLTEWLNGREQVLPQL